MKATVKYTLHSYEEEIDLEDFGHDEDTRFEDLTDEQKNEITDQLSEEKVVLVSVETVDDEDW